METKKQAFDSSNPFPSALSLLLHLPISCISILFAMEVHKQNQQRSIEASIKNPSTKSSTAISIEMQVNHYNRHSKAERKLDDLTVSYHFLPRWFDP